VEQAATGVAEIERSPRFVPPDILWYFGGLAAAFGGAALVSGASTAHRGVWMLIVGLAVMAAFGGLAAGFIWAGRRIAGGVLAAAVVWVAPATEVGFERLCGVHPRLFGGTVQVAIAGVGVRQISSGGGFHGALFSIAIGTAVVGLAVFWIVRFAFVLFPVAVSLAAGALLFVPAVVANPGANAEVAAAAITGVAFFVAGLLLDARLHRRHAFWWYAIGLLEIAIAFAYFLARYHDAWLWLLLFVVAVLLLASSAPTRRSVWTVYAVAGAYAGLAHYAGVVTGSWRTTLALTLIALLLVFVGAWLELVDAGLVARLARRRSLPSR
jgi:hypothetical protein